MIIVRRLVIIVAVAGLLPACSSEMTRFDVPVMGMKKSPEPDYTKRYDDGVQRKYSQTNDYGYNDQPDYKTGRRDYSRSEYGQDQQDYSQYGQKPIKTRRYEGRDVYDTASTDNPYKPQNRYKNKYAQNQLERDQLPALQEKQQVRQKTYEQRKDIEQTYRVAGDLSRKPALDDRHGRHVVAEGDTLYNISRRYNVSTDDVRRSNDLASNDIQLGQHIYIPGLGKKSNAPIKKVSSNLGADGYYQVQKGDTVYNLSRRFGVTRQELAEANGIEDMTQVRLGQKLVIPGTGKKTPVQVASIDKKSGVKALGAKRRAAIKKPAAKKQAHKIKAVDSGLGKKLSSSNRFIWPASGKILSKFGRQKSGTINDGVNVALPKGTVIKAADGGVVAYAGSELKGYGNLILIRHANNWVTAYAHNSKLLVKRGQKVRRGQAIAKSGKSGSVLQPQLHFELRKGSKPVNPLKYLAMR